MHKGKKRREEGRGIEKGGRKGKKFKKVVSLQLASHDTNLRNFLIQTLARKVRKILLVVTFLVPGEFDIVCPVETSAGDDGSRTLKSRVLVHPNKRGGTL